ncbi:hypothetical protein DPMN_050251 [Dreissena polymorpha]|uniref:Uncharacterized protein n=1 Tax=Dreissena polymorpha TaxID=45954 RepID=A0A9D4HMW3_DREPO|nr:hypothetical protein DPMN_050251 [Dreissena polymorpha]
MTYTVHRANEYVRNMTATLNIPHEAWFGHVTRNYFSMQDCSPSHARRKRRRGRLTKGWIDKSKEWTFLPMDELLSTAHNKTEK